MDWNSVKWILFCIVYHTCRCKAQVSDWGWQMQPPSLSGFPIRSETACESYPIIMRCPGEDVIQIVSAEYGRRTQYKCSASLSETENTNCALNEAKDIVSQKCNNKTECTFQVSSKNFPDPCPGTLKYLEAKFNCLRYMFNCPGSLTGIGQEISTTIDVRPQAGTWTKDPLFNVQHIFYAPVGKTVYEYSTWNDFAEGKSLTTYALPHNMAGGKFVVYDRNLYYVKEKSHSIVRYNLMAKTVMRDVEFADRAGGLRSRQNMSLSVDERGLWVVYSRSNGAMAFSKLDKDQLSVEKTWCTTRRASQYRYAFFICGVLYAVDRRSGKIDFSYNTNLRSNQEKRSLNIQLDLNGQSSRQTSKGNQPNFLRYNALSVTYNPRDQLIYTWDSANGNAIYYKLNFDGNDPANAVQTTRTIPTTTTKIVTMAPKAKVSSTTAAITKTTTEPTPPKEQPRQPPVEHCPSISRGGLQWPETKVGDLAKVECPSKKEEFATWKCEHDSSMREPDWHVAGPDLSRCNMWVSQISANYKSGLIGWSTAFDTLAAKVASEEPDSEMMVRDITSLVNKLFEESTIPSQEEARKMAEAMSSISGNILNNEKAMSLLNKESQSEVASSLMNSTEKAGFLYAETIAQTPLDMRLSGSDPVVIKSESVLMQIDVRERTMNETELAGVTTFPDESVCSASDESCGQDMIELPTGEIMSQQVTGPAIVVFSLFHNLSQYLDSSTESDWEVDSKVVSATLQQQHYHTSLRKPAVITLRHNEASSSPHRCVYWDFTASDGKGNWSDSGCSLRSSNSTHSVCECNHLTSFAVLVNHVGIETEPHHDQALDIITKVGISISLICLVMCIATFSYFRNLRSDRNSVHKHLCICLFIAEAVFLIGIDRTGNPVACSVIAGILHYFFLAAFLWMAVEGFMLYVMLVEIFETGSRWKWYYLSGYGIPAVIVGISAGVDYTGYGTDEVCWLRIDSGFIWSFVGPVVVIVVVNLGFLSMTVYKMYVHTLAFTDIGKINSIKASVRGASVLVCLLGITWAFGILWISENMAVLAYLFCIFNAFQGMFIFIFHCVLPRKVRQEYRRLCSRLPCSENFGLDSYVSNSSSFSKKYTVGRYPVSTSLPQSQLRRMWNETVAPRNSEEVITSEVASSNSLQNREPSRPVISPSRNIPRQYPQSDRNYLQEDEVFLPPTSDNTRTQLVLNRTADDLHYDRLQHHHHADDYLVFPGEARPLGNFETGRAPTKGHFGHHNHPPIASGHQTPRMGIRHFGPKSMSQSKIQEMITGGVDFGGSGNWDIRRSHRENQRPLRRSFDENISGKRDSGIGLQRPPSGSGVLSQNYQAGYRRSLDNVLAEMNTNESNDARTKRARRISLDNVERPRFPSTSHQLPPLQANARGHEMTSLSHRIALAKSGTTPGNGHQKRKSISSDSDDPIVTDCSVSSAGSSSGNHTSISSRPTNISYYEEPICQKKQHQYPGRATNHDRPHMCRHSNVSDGNTKDENDLEVAMITSSDGSLDPRHDTLGYPSYRPPTPPQDSDALSPPTASIRRRTGENRENAVLATQRTEVTNRNVPQKRTLPVKPPRYIKPRSYELEDGPRRTVTGL